jgi:hypothetical protein
MDMDISGSGDVLPILSCSAISPTRMAMSCVYWFFLEHNSVVVHFNVVGYPSIAGDKIIFQYLSGTISSIVEYMDEKCNFRYSIEDLSHVLASMVLRYVDHVILF